MIEKLIDALKAKIEECGLELLARYPNDLLVHDRAMLERHAFPGTTIAWMVGHSHTHMVPLGLHKEENQIVTYLTNMANDDRFYVIAVSSVGFRLTEIGRKRFAALATTPVMYAAEGCSPSDFWLVREGSRVGHIALEPVGGMQDRSYRVSITPVSGITEADRGALHLWGQRAVVNVSHSLFTRFTIEWQPMVAMLQAA